MSDYDHTSAAGYVPEMLKTEADFLTDRVRAAKSTSVVTESDLLFAKTLTWHATKNAIRVGVLILCVMFVVGLLGAIPIIVKAWKEYVLGVSGFTQKEHMLDQTASRNITRDDTGWPSGDSLAEQWSKAQQATTKIPDSFRERMEEKTPEEKLMASLSS
jgi:hypothetical protein